MGLELEGKLVRLENGSWARYRAVPLSEASGVQIVVAIELTREEQERAEREAHAPRTLH